MKLDSEQLRIAAQIIENGHDWNTRVYDNTPWEKERRANDPHLAYCVRQGFEIRIKPEPKTVPLTAEDVPPGSALRYKLACAPERFRMVTSVSSDAINVYSRTGLAEIGWDRALAEMEIKRPGCEWEPCHKIVSE